MKVLITFYPLSLSSSSSSLLSEKCLKVMRKGRFDSTPSNIDPSAPRSFTTHEDLDRFVRDLMTKKYPDVSLDEAIKEFKGDPTSRDFYRLLKAFDRAFWLGSFANRSDSKFRSLTEEEKSCCPFSCAEKLAPAAHLQAELW